MPGDETPAACGYARSEVAVMRGQDEDSRHRGARQLDAL